MEKFFQTNVIFFLNSFRVLTKTFRKCLTKLSVFYYYEAYDHAGMSNSKTTDELIVDVTPPFVGEIAFSDVVRNNRYVSSDFTVHLNGFYDDESGIAYFELVFGKQLGVADVQKAKKYNTDKIEVCLKDISALDGSTYYIMAKV